MRHERIAFHEFFQARDRSILYGVPESLPD